LFNHADTAFEIKKGDRIAQLILEKIVTPPVLEVESLEETERGSGGYGSTGTSTIVSHAPVNPLVEAIQPSNIEKVINQQEEESQ
jgi:hypothetical protein